MMCWIEIFRTTTCRQTVFVGSLIFFREGRRRVRPRGGAHEGAFIIQREFVAGWHRVELKTSSDALSKQKVNVSKYENSFKRRW